MKGLVYEAPKRLVLRELERPEPGPGEVLLRNRAVGICASDVWGYLGLGPAGRRIPPLIMGHEVVGEVVSAGPGTSLDSGIGVRLGALVAVNPIVSCGECRPCRRGAENLCHNLRIMGVHSTPGAMVEYSLAPVKNIVPLGDVTPSVGTLAEPLAMGTHALTVLRRHFAADLASARFAIIGAGTIGLAVLAALRAAGAESVVVCDIRDDRLARLKDLVPSVETVNTAQIEWGDIRNRYAPEGFDAVFEAVGRSETAHASAEMAGVGGTVVWIGFLEPTVSVPMIHVASNEIVISGVVRFTAKEFGESVERLRRQSWLSGAVDRVLPLGEAPEAFDLLASGAEPILKIVLDPTSRV